MRWNEALAKVARGLDTVEIHRLLADPDVTANGRQILQSELEFRAVDVPRQRRPDETEVPSARNEPPQVSA